LLLSRRQAKEITHKDVSCAHPAAVSGICAWLLLAHNDMARLHDTILHVATSGSCPAARNSASCSIDADCTD